MADLKEVTQKRKSFPRQPLQKVLELTDAIFKIGHGDPVRRRTAFDEIGRSPDSSTSSYLLQAASGGYSLVNGSKTSNHLELTETGKNLSSLEKPIERLNAVHDLLYSNKFFVSIVEKYKERPFPNDEVVTDYLVRELKLSQSDAQICWSTAKQNILDFNLFEESGNKKIILDRDHAIKGFTNSNNSNTTEEITIEEISQPVKEEHLSPSNGATKELYDLPTNEKTVKSYKSLKNIPQITFNIQVVLPENATPEVYEAIFSSMSTHLLGRDEE